MLVFSPPQTVKNRRLFVPAYLRAALGFHSGTLHLSTQAHEDAALPNELLISPIPLQSRSDIWLLRASMSDRPGIIAELTRHLSDLGIDIISCRVQTIENSRIIILYLLLGAKFYKARYDGDTNDRSRAPLPSLPELRAQLVGLFIEDIQFSAAGKPNLSIRRNLSLFQSATTPGFRDTVHLHRGWIEIPHELLERIRESYLEHYPGVDLSRGRNKLPHAYLAADVEASILRITIFYRNTGYIHVRIQGRNRVGALAAMSNALRGAGFNIECMYARNISNEEEAITDLLLHLPYSEERKRDDARLRSAIRDVLTTPQARTFDFRIVFPEPTPFVEEED